MSLTNAQILAKADAWYAHERAKLLMAEQNIKWTWEGTMWAAQGKPVTECWNHVQLEAYKAWQQDDEYYADVQPAEMREDYVGE
jgi:hypothetical protein